MANGVFNPLAACDDAEELLRRLSYQERFCDSEQLPSLRRWQLVLPPQSDAAAAQQFMLVMQLIRWLLLQIDACQVEVSEFEDPNVIVASLLDAADRALTSNTGDPNCSLLQTQSRGDWQKQLRRAHGGDVARLICILAARALQKCGQAKLVDVERPERRAVTEEIGELAAESSDFDAPRPASVEEEEAEADEFLGLYASGDDEQEKLSQENEDLKSTEGIILEQRREIDSRRWHLEALRVAPQLLRAPVQTDSQHEQNGLHDEDTNEFAGLDKALAIDQVRLTAQSKSWLSQLQAMRKFASVLKQHAKAIQEPLAAKQREARDSTVATSEQERSLSAAHAETLRRLRGVSRQLTETKKELQDCTRKIADLQQQLWDIEESLNAVETQIEAQHAGVSDVTPVRRLKKAINELRAEIDDMELNIGVARFVQLQNEVETQRRRRSAAAKKRATSTLGTVAFE
ncbi:MAG: hypothetical protein MHM6MM_002072 [Cercozoa sp. M6MM]